MDQPKSSSSRLRRVAWVVGLLLVATAASIFFCRDFLKDLSTYGWHDWDLFYFHTLSAYRAVADFGEIPLWNPWEMGGMPMLGNPQSLIPDPWIGLDFALGPIAAIRIKMLLHYILGLGGVYWCGRQFGMARLAAVYTAGTWIFSSWLAMRVQAGHLCFMCAIYIPWVVGCLQAARKKPHFALYGAFVLTIMAFEAAATLLVILAFFTGIFAVGAAVQDRSLRPILALLILWFSFLGLSAVKLLPAAKLLIENPREVETLGGRGWEAILGDSTTTKPPETAEAKPTSTPSPRKVNKAELPAFVTKLFLGREQRAGELYYSVQGYYWHEYGCYVGPLAILLLLMAPFYRRSTWPLMLIVVICFAIAAGNVSRFAPWTLLHKIPIMRSMRVSGRFLIPVSFAICLIAGLVLDKILRKIGCVAEESPETEAPARPQYRWAKTLAIFLVLAALVDTMLVGRHSLEGAFPYPAPPALPQRAEMITVRDMPEGRPQAVLANYSTLWVDEAIPIKVNVTPRDAPNYRGEYYFDADTAGAAAEVKLLKWSPNTSTVSVTTDKPGFVVLNRNWGQGWLANAPYEAVSHNGLISAHVPAGTHAIHFRYHPAIFYLGLTISIISLAAVVGVLVRIARRRPPGGTATNK